MTDEEQKSLDNFIARTKDRPLPDIQGMRILASFYNSILKIAGIVMFLSAIWYAPDIGLWIVVLFLASGIAAKYSVAFDTLIRALDAMILLKTARDK